MNGEQKKGNRIIDEKDEPEDRPKDPYATSASAGGFIGAVAGYAIKRTMVTGLDWWQSSLFVGAAAVAGSLVAMGCYYIWERFLKRFCE